MSVLFLMEAAQKAERTLEAQPGWRMTGFIVAKQQPEEHGFRGLAPLQLGICGSDEVYCKFIWKHGKQGAESIHVSFNTVERVYASTANCVQRQKKRQVFIEKLLSGTTL